jgi:glucosamine-6-phosphate deaminase
VLDVSAAWQLTRFQCPWTINGANGSFEAEYDLVMTKKAVAWLSKKTKKFILSLEENDYRENGLLDILIQNDCNAPELNFKIWSNYLSCISHWPVGGAPENWETLPFKQHKTNDPKKVIIFSPHPDDDVICMGATMEKLNKQGHEVYVAYQTSGAFAVSYDNVVKNLRFASKYFLFFKLK